jgi:hypothetical protein
MKQIEAKEGSQGRKTNGTRIWCKAKRPLTEVGIENRDVLKELFKKSFKRDLTTI